MSVSTSQNDCSFLMFTQSYPTPSPQPFIGAEPTEKAGSNVLQASLVQGQKTLFYFGMFIIIFIIILPYTSFNFNLTPNLTKFGKHIRTSDIFFIKCKNEKCRCPIACKNRQTIDWTRMVLVASTRAIKTLDQNPRIRLFQIYISY